MTASSSAQAISRISTWHLLARCLLAATLFTAGGCKYKSDALRTQLGTPEGSTTFFMAFDASDTPVVSNGHGHVFRLEADQWVQLPFDGLVGNGLPLPIMYTHDGACLATSSIGSIFRLEAGATTWQMISGTNSFRSQVVEASDGTLYTTGPAPAGSPDLYSPQEVWFMKPGGAWVDAGYLVNWWPAVADQDGNLWTNERLADGDAVQRLHESTTDRIVQPWLKPAMLNDVHTLIGVRGSKLVGASTNYASSYGEVIELDPQTQMAKLVSDGMKCHDTGTYFSCDLLPGRFIGANAMGPNGEAYELFQNRNGGEGTLMIMEQGDDTWNELTGTVDAGSAIYVSRHGTVYLTSARQIERVEK